MAPQTDDYGRTQPPFAAGELDTLLGFLDYQRATLQWKTSGLGETELRQPLAPSAMTLGGLLSHFAYVEDYWFGEVAAESGPSEPWASTDWEADMDADWSLGKTLSPDELRGMWDSAVSRSRDIVKEAVAKSGADALDQTHPAWGGREQISLRWILVHMIEEYARHNGHADLLREAIDGETGE